MVEDRKAAITKFQKLFRTSFEIKSEEKKVMLAVDQIWNYYPERSVVIGILPIGNIGLRGAVVKYIENRSSKQ